MFEVVDDRSRMSVESKLTLLTGGLKSTPRIFSTNTTASRSPYHPTMTRVGPVGEAGIIDLVSESIQSRAQTCRETIIQAASYGWGAGCRQSGPSRATPWDRATTSTRRGSQYQRHWSVRGRSKSPLPIGNPEEILLTTPAISKCSECLNGQRRHT